jgi:hypothetical protein
MTSFNFRRLISNPKYFPYGKINVKKNLYYLNKSFSYVSPLDCSSVDWDYPVGGNGYNNTCSESDPCSGLKTFEEALQYAYNNGGRLPTLDEALNNATSGTGCDYDAEMIWTCDKGTTDQEHWTVLGLDGSGSETLLSNDEKAYVRFIADIDINRTDPIILIDDVIKSWLMEQL